MNLGLLHPITEEEKSHYKEHGVVCIRNQFDTEWIDKMFTVCSQNEITPGGTRSVQKNKNDPGKFVATKNMSRENSDIMDFVIRSPAAEIAGQLMDLKEVRFFYDQLFVKEPGTLAPTAWHNDLPFWPLNGNQIASVWIALTDIPKENSGLVYVSGSHKWETMYYPEPATPDAFDEYVIDPDIKKLEHSPMFHENFDNPDYHFLSWDMKAGDCLVHHPLAVHGSGKNESQINRRVAISIRYYGGDVTWHGQRTKFEVPGATDDIFTRGTMPINDDLFPVAWQKRI